MNFRYGEERQFSIEVMNLYLLFQPTNNGFCLLQRHFQRVTIFLMRWAKVSNGLPEA